MAGPIRLAYLNRATRDLAAADEAIFDDVVPALVAGILRQQKPSKDAIQIYLREAAQLISSKNDKDSELLAFAKTIEQQAENVNTGAGLFSVMCKIAEAGGTEIQANEIAALANIGAWLLDNAKPGRRADMAEIMLEEAKDIIAAPEELAEQAADALVEALEAARDAANVSIDTVDPSILRSSLELFELNEADKLLVGLKQAPGFKRAGLTLKRVRWFRELMKRPDDVTTRGVPTIGDTFRSARAEIGVDVFDKIAAQIDALEARAQWHEAAWLDYEIYDLAPKMIPAGTIRNTAMAAAKIFNMRGNAIDTESLSALELNEAIATLAPDGDAVKRKELLKLCHDEFKLDISDPEAATQLLHDQLQVVADFMKADNNDLMRNGYAALEIGRWKVKRTPETVLCNTFALPNRDGQLNYELKNFAEAEKLHEHYSECFRRSGLNCVTYVLEDKLYVATFPFGDLEDVLPGETQLPLFDAQGVPRENPGRVVGKVDPLSSSSGEALVRTFHRFLHGAKTAISDKLNNPETRGAQMVKEAGKTKGSAFNSPSWMIAAGVGAVALNSATYVAVAGFGILPSAINFLDFAFSHLRHREIYKGMGMTVLKSIDR